MADGSRRFQVLDDLPFAPGCDYITRTPNGPFIDTGVFIGVGTSRERVYLSQDTIFEMADTLGLFDSVRESGQERYHEGYNDAVKENLGGDLRDIADRLGAVVPYLSGLAGDPAPVGSSAPEDALGTGGALEDEERGDEPFVVDSVESIAERTSRAGGQGDGARSDDRPAGVPAGAGDESAFRI